MARTTGPLMSLAASGSVAKTLTFAHWKGRPYVRQLVTPSNPKSDGQYFTRAMMAFLSQTWKTLTGLQQASWNDLAKQGNFSAFNAFVRENMRRWTQGSAPMQDTLGTAGGGASTLGTLAGVGGVRQIVVSQTITTILDGWSLAIELQPNGQPNSLATTRKVVDVGAATNGQTIVTTISNLDPGSYDLQAICGVKDGSQFSSNATATGIVVT